MKNYIMKGKMVGTLKDDRVYITHRNKNHFFRIYQGFGMSSSILEDLHKLNCRKIVIIYDRVDETQEIYESTPEQFIEEGIIWKDLDLDFQKILPISKLRKRGLPK